MTATAGPCDAGFYCNNGSSNSQQQPCPEGRYCERGTHHPKLCPAGTFLNSTMAKSSSDCTSCTAGSYCETEGLTKPTGLCKAGYYCPRGSSNKTTIECPIGTYCPEESATYKRCPSWNVHRLCQSGNLSYLSWWFLLPSRECYTRYA